MRTHCIEYRTVMHSSSVQKYLLGALDPLSLFIEVMWGQTRVHRREHALYTRNKYMFKTYTSLNTGCFSLTSVTFSVTTNDFRAV